MATTATASAVGDADGGSGLAPFPTEDAATCTPIGTEEFDVLVQERRALSLLFPSGPTQAVHCTGPLQSLRGGYAAALP